MPDENVLAGVDMEVHPSADDIVAQARSFRPDHMLGDYHLAGGLTGLDALLSLQRATDLPAIPVLTMAGDPADNQGMRSAGAVGGLPFSFLRDVFTRTIIELTG